MREQQFHRYDPLSNTFGMVRVNHTRPHQGWDLEAPPGTAVYTIAPGTIEASESDSYGKCLTLEFLHRGHIYYAFYAHLSARFMDKCSVAEGVVIGLTGMTGNAHGIPTGEAHLHFEIRVRSAVGRGLGGRIDPGEILGYGTYSSKA